MGATEHFEVGSDMIRLCCRALTGSQLEDGLERGWKLGDCLSGAFSKHLKRSVRSWRSKERMALPQGVLPSRRERYHCNIESPPLRFCKCGCLPSRE